MRTPCHNNIILYHAFYLSSEYPVITIYFAFSRCFTLSRRPVTAAAAAAVPTYSSNRLPTFQSNSTYGRRRICARVRLDGTATADAIVY